MLTQKFSLELSSLVATNYASASSNSYHYNSFAGKDGVAAALRIGNLQGTGHLQVNVYHSTEDPRNSTVPALWKELYTFPQFNASSGISILQSAMSSQVPLLPYIKITAEARATGAGQFSVSTINAALLA